MKIFLYVLTVFSLSSTLFLSAQMPEIKTLADAKREGMKNQKAKKYAEAIQCYEKGAKIAKTPFEKQQMLGFAGLVYSLKKEYTSAVAKYVEAASVEGITTDEKLLNLYYAGHYSSLKKDNENTVKYFRESSGLKDIKKYRNLQLNCAIRLCSYLYSMKKYDDCIKEAEVFLAKTDNGGVLVNLSEVKADCLAAKKDLAGAKKVMEDVMQKKNLSDDLMLVCARKLAGLYARERKFDKAAEILEKVITENKNGKSINLRFTAMNEAAGYYNRMREYQKALLTVKKYENEIKNPGTKLSLYTTAMLASHQMKDSKGGLEWSKKAEEFLPASASYLQYSFYDAKGKLLELAKDYASAEKAYLAVENIKGINKNYISAAYSNIAVMYYLRVKDLAKAKENMDKAKKYGKWYNAVIAKLIERDLAKQKK